MVPRCPGELELARALGGEGDPAVVAHIAGCLACRGAQEGFAQVIALARQLPLDLPSRSRREEVRTAVLAASSLSMPSRVPVRRPVPVRGLLFAGIAAAAVVLLHVAPPRSARGVREAAPAAEAHGTVHAQPGARLAVRAEPPPQLAGEAPALKAAGAGDQARPRRPARPAISVTPPPLEVAPAPEVVPAPPSPAPEAAPSPRPPPAPPLPARAADELAYDDAWAAMRAGDFTRAATAFSRVFLLAPDGALAEDASFWHAVALARGGRRAESITAFRDFLAMHARSARAGEASAMVGWLLVESGQRDEAARRFQAAAADPRPAVRRSAREGLDALARRTRPK